MAGKVDIFNLALTMLGAQTVSLPTENTKNAKNCSAVYDMIRRSELRKNAWNFAIKLSELAASATTPAFGRSYSYPLPADFVALAPPYPEMNSPYVDWLVQNGQIYTNDTSPLQVRYIYDVQDTSLFDPSFVEALAARIARTICDSITQSNTKIQIADARYKEAIAEAKSSNSFDNVSSQPPEDTFLSVRI